MSSQKNLASYARNADVARRYPEPVNSLPLNPAFQGKFRGAA